MNKDKQPAAVDQEAFWSDHGDAWVNDTDDGVVWESDTDRAPTAPTKGE